MNTRANHFAIDEEEEWTVICVVRPHLEGTFDKISDFDNYSDAKQEFDNCVKATETDPRYVEIALWTSKRKRSFLLIIFNAANVEAAARAHPVHRPG